MPYDRPDYSHYGRGEYGPAYEEPRTPYGTVYTRPSHGYETGYDGGGPRSRGSYGAGPLRPRPMTLEESEFRWGGGYVGGRGYGGTNFDYEHGYRTGGRGQAWQRERGGGMIGGPTRYGYGPYHGRLKRRQRSDNEIQEDVREALFYDTWVDADRIRIDVEEGVVTLEGTLPDFDEVRYATDDAWDVDGVRGVRTELNVDTSTAGDRLGRQREFTAGQLAEANESDGGARERGGMSGEFTEGRRPGARTTPRSGGAGLAPRLDRTTSGPPKGERLKPRPGATSRTRAVNTDTGPEARGGPAGELQRPGTERSAGQWTRDSKAGDPNARAAEPSGEPEERGG